MEVVRRAVSWVGAEGEGFPGVKGNAPGDEISNPAVNALGLVDPRMTARVLGHVERVVKMCESSYHILRGVR